MAEQKVESVKAELVKSEEALGAMERASLDMQIQTAKRYPREMSRVIRKVQEFATIDRETAESCFYAIPREGKVIDGPSIRLAEIVASSWGNLRVAARIISVDESFVTAQGLCHDLEANVAVAVEVKRRITTRSGARYSEDMIGVTSQAACAIALRNAVFKVVPMGSLHTVMAEIEKVGLGDERSLGDRRTAALAYFKGKKVDAERIFAHFGVKSADGLTLEHVKRLRQYVQALTDGEASMEDIFAKPVEVLKPGRQNFGRKATPPPATPAEKDSGAKEPGPAEDVPPNAPAADPGSPAPAHVDEETGEIFDDDVPPHDYDPNDPIIFEGKQYTRSEMEGLLYDWRALLKDKDHAKEAKVKVAALEKALE